MDQPMHVVAASHPVPLEDGTGYVDGPEPRPVPNTLYYRRRIQSGELLVPTATEPPPSDGQNTDSSTNSRSTRSRQSAPVQADQTPSSLEDAA